MKTTDADKFRVFLCHANDDKPIVRSLHEKLTKDQIDAWFDEIELIPGQEWQSEIPKAIRRSDVVLVLLSNHSVTKEGYVQKELKFALDIAKEKPEGTIFLIPVRLENCEVPSSLSQWQWVDYFEDKGYEKLIKSFNERAKKIGKKVRTLRQDLLFICEICNKPISVFENEGQIYISNKELVEAQRISKELSKREGLIPLSDVEGNIAHWHKVHYGCSKEIDSFYEIEIHRIKTLQKLIGWTSHLMSKKWISNTDWPILLREVLREPDNLL